MECVFCGESVASPVTTHLGDHAHAACRDARLCDVCGKRKADGVCDECAEEMERIQDMIRRREEYEAACDRKLDEIKNGDWD